MDARLYLQTIEREGSNIQILFWHEVWVKKGSSFDCNKKKKKNNFLAWHVPSVFDCVTAMVFKALASCGSFKAIQ